MGPGALLWAITFFLDQAGFTALAMPGRMSQSIEKLSKLLELPTGLKSGFSFMRKVIIFEKSTYRIILKSLCRNWVVKNAISIFLMDCLLNMIMQYMYTQVRAYQNLIVSQMLLPNKGFSRPRHLQGKKVHNWPVQTSLEFSSL